MIAACAVCGRSVRTGQTFCTGCGGRLDGVQVQAAIGGSFADSDDPMVAPAEASSATLVDASTPLIAGPVDRVTFQAEQARRRRRTWQLTAVCGLAAILTGIPASLVFTPVLLALLFVVTKIVELTAGLPGDIWDLYERALFPLIRVIDEYTDESAASPPLTALVHAALVWVVPGMLAMLLIWPTLRALFMRGGVGGTLLALGARPPRGDDLEERQLVNVVEEMAIAAGLPPPDVMLIDAETANAAAIGTGPGNATVVVSRRLLDDLNRDETQGVLANLVASIGNGDLRIALSIISVYQTYAVVYALLKAPFSPLARAALRRMVRWTFAFRGHRGHAAEAEIVAEMLSRGMWESDENDAFARATETPVDAPQQGASRYLSGVPAIFIAILLLGLVTQAPIPFEVMLGIPIVIAAVLVLADLRYVTYAGGRAVTWAVLIVSLPYYIGGFMSQFLITFLAWLVLGPLLALVWRTRRYLADATAVQLTRNPSAVAGGLLSLQRSGGMLSGGRWAAPLFVVGQEVEQGRVTAEATARAAADQQMARAALGGLWRGDPTAAAGFAERMKEYEAGEATFAGEPGSMITLNPPIARRLKRLRAMGADVGGHDGHGGVMHPSQFMFGVFGMVLVAILIPIAFVLLLVVMALMAVFTLACGALMMAVVYGLLQLLR